jgi:hypothetical protein
MRQVLAAKRISDAWPDRTNHPHRTEPSLHSCCRQLREGNGNRGDRECGKNAEHAHGRQFVACQEIPWAHDHGYSSMPRPAATTAVAPESATSQAAPAATSSPAVPNSAAR